MKTVSAAIAFFLLAGGAGQAMTLSSDQLREGMPMAKDQAYAQCKGANLSPALSWRGAPQGTKSFAITMFDPNAAGGKGFWHWLVFNIPANEVSLAEGAGAASGSALPAGAMQGQNDWGEIGYGGPCPPKGQTHRYIFTVWALDTDRLSLNAGATGAQLRPQLQMHVLARAVLTPRYSH